MTRYIALIVFCITAILVLPQTTFAAASLYMTPSSGTFAVGKTFDVTLYADSQGQTINTAEANLNFSTATLDVVSVKQGSVFYLPTPASPNASGGQIYIGGGLPNPGYNGPGGALGVITFKAKAAGAAWIKFSRGQVLLNNGAGTDILSKTIDASFNVVVDTTPPNPFTIGLVNESDVNNVSSTPTISFNATDNLSGIDHYEVYGNGKLIDANATSPFSFSKQAAGGLMVMVVAFDGAGNQTSSDLPLIIAAPPVVAPIPTTPVPTQQQVPPAAAGYFKKFIQDPIYALLFLILILVGVFGFLLLRQKKDESTSPVVAVQMAMMQMELDRMLQFEFDLSRLRQELLSKFSTLAGDRVSGQFQAEVDERIQAEIERNVESLTSRINAQFELLSKAKSKDLDILHKQLENKIQSAINKNTRILNDLARRHTGSLADDEAYNDIASRIEILERLQSQISASNYTNWQGRQNPDNT